MPSYEPEPRASLSEQATEIELALFERVPPSVVAGELNQVEDVEKHRLVPPTVPQ